MENGKLLSKYTNLQVRAYCVIFMVLGILLFLLSLLCIFYVFVPGVVGLIFSMLSFSASKKYKFELKRRRENDVILENTKDANDVVLGVDNLSSFDHFVNDEPCIDFCDINIDEDFEEYTEHDDISEISCMRDSLSFKVAGVTFKTGRKSRQVMLKNMYFNNTPPFDGDIDITFKRYDYEGKLAIGVYANDLQIGNVPASLIDQFDSYWKSDYIATFDVYGGGNRSWGCSIDVTFY